MVTFNHQTATNTPLPENVEDFKLHMPSSLTPQACHQFCQPILLQMEEHICDTEAHDTLEDLCHHLPTWSHTNKWKITNVTRQIHNTQVWEWQACIDDYIHVASSKYRRVWATLLALWGHGDWEEELQVLDQSDVQVLNERQLTMKEKDEIRAVQRHVGIEDNDEDVEDEWVTTTAATVRAGQRRLSWIWFNGTTCEDINDPATWAGKYLWFS